MEVISHQSVVQNHNAAKSLQASHELQKSLCLDRTVPGGLEDKAAVNHPGNAVVKTLTLSLDSWETHRFRAIYTTKYKNVLITYAAIDFLTCPYYSIPAALFLFELVELPNKCFVRHMKRVEAKIEENRKEDSASEPDKDPNAWLIEAKLDEDIFDWETVRLDFRFAEIEAEIVESSMSEPNRFTVRTHGEAPLKRGDVIHVDIREQNQG